jgi:hypothetical protein
LLLLCCLCLPSSRYLRGGREGEGRVVEGRRPVRGGGRRGEESEEDGERRRKSRGMGMRTGRRIGVEARYKVKRRVKKQKSCVKERIWTMLLFFLFLSLLVYCY